MVHCSDLEMWCHAGPPSASIISMIESGIRSWLKFLWISLSPISRHMNLNEPCRFPDRPMQMQGWVLDSIEFNCIFLKWFCMFAKNELVPPLGFKLLVTYQFPWAICGWHAQFNRCIRAKNAKMNKVNCHGSLTVFLDYMNSTLYFTTCSFATLVLIIISGSSEITLSNSMWSIWSELQNLLLNIHELFLLSYMLLCSVGLQEFCHYYPNPLPKSNHKWQVVDNHDIHHDNEFVQSLGIRTKSVTMHSGIWKTVSPNIPCKCCRD